MIIELKKKPKNVTIIEGFPGFGLVGTISTEYLIDYLKTEIIGKIWLKEMPAIAAIHDNKVIEPVTVHYNKRYNLVIVHGITATAGIEWKLTEALLDVAKQLKAKEIISIEGIGSAAPNEEPQVFYYTSDKKRSTKFKNYKLKILSEGIIIGITGALMLKTKTMPLSCIFAETATNLPDSRAAAKVIKILDQYLGLKVNPKPLISQAEKFEEKLKMLMKSSQKISEESKKKQLSYMG